MCICITYGDRIISEEILESDKIMKHYSTDLENLIWLQVHQRWSSAIHQMAIYRYDCKNII